MLSPFLRQRLRGFLSQPKKEDLAVLKTLVEAGKVTPVIDRTYPLSEVPEAMCFLADIVAVQPAQYAPGVTPVHRRKARLNALGSENPVRNATSAADVPRTAR
jgi:hypothetical protein